MSITRPVPHGWGSRTCLVNVGNMKQTRKACRVAAGLIASLAIATMASATTAADSDWPSYGRDTNEDRFSPLTEINADSIGKLGLAWSLDLPREARSLEATPLEVNGVLYFTTSLSVVYAVDVRTGRRLWVYD